MDIQYGTLKEKMICTEYDFWSFFHHMNVDWLTFSDWFSSSDSQLIKMYQSAEMDANLQSDRNNQLQHEIHKAKMDVELYIRKNEEFKKLNNQLQTRYSDMLIKFEPLKKVDLRIMSLSLTNFTNEFRVVG